MSTWLAEGGLGSIVAPRGHSHGHSRVQVQGQCSRRSAPRGLRQRPIRPHKQEPSLAFPLLPVAQDLRLIKPQDVGRTVRPLARLIGPHSLPGGQLLGTMGWSKLFRHRILRDSIDVPPEIALLRPSQATSASVSNANTAKLVDRFTAMSPLIFRVLIPLSQELSCLRCCGTILYARTFFKPMWACRSSRIFCISDVPMAAFGLHRGSATDIIQD